jgi:hypothetical protein
MDKSKNTAKPVGLDLETIFKGACANPPNLLFFFRFMRIE